MRLILMLALLPAAALADDLVATRNLPAGTILATGDVAVTPSARAGLAPADALGKQLRTAVYEGRPISKGQLTTPTLVSRNQLVTLAYENAALRIETEGRALGAGGEGDLIRVMNLSSRATLMARINADGTLTVAQR
ncbi:flagellar basal body P-ring formation chaperone FlgA [Paracoccus chinensis]|uniref:Flagella basal body P-ring formation protein FlgA n=1 Tax=Paracoccus chinensis TaxID=525640 RepID=A0A1G9HY12_9RHOB|nr:flagellar basal body P-ring formation chaperone FlgA [Paracoccus chinensis]SDL17860.1 flagella basal body P-ring formation protein FlgA [Paracoccus chinensis]